MRDSADAGIGQIVQGCIMAVAYRQVRILPGARINPSGRTAALTAISSFCAPLQNMINRNSTADSNRP